MAEELSDTVRAQANVDLMQALTDPSLLPAQRKKAIEKALDAGADVNTTIRTGANPHGSTPLMWAAQQGYDDVIDLLIQRGADPLIRNAQGKTALSYAKQPWSNRSRDANSSTVQKINNGLNHQLMSVVTSTELTSEQKRERVGQLIAAGASINTTCSADNFNSLKSTPLMWAAQQGDVELAQYLIQRGADSSITNAQGKTAADYANQAPEATRAAMQQLIKDRQAEQQFRTSVNSDNYRDVFNYTGNVDSTNDPLRSTQLMHAAQNGNAESVVALLAKNANPTLQNNLGRTPLMYAAQKGDKDGKCLTHILNDPRTDVNQRDKDGKTALDWLKANSTLPETLRNQLIQDLQKRGAKTGAELDQGNTAIRTAAKDGNTEELNNLLGQKYTVNGQQVPVYDVNSTDNTGNTALHYAASSGKKESITALVQAGADVNKPNSNGQIPLHRAAQLGHTEAVSALLEAGSNPNTLDGSSLTPLMYATISGQKDAALALANHNETNINHQNERGNTALMIAVQNNQLEIAQALINAGADVNLQNKDGKTALDLAQGNDSMQAALTAEGVGAKTSAELTEAIQRGMAESYTLNPSLVPGVNSQEIPIPQAVTRPFDEINASLEETSRQTEDLLKNPIPTTRNVDILDFSDQAHTNAQRDAGRQRTVSIQGRRSVRISKPNQQTAIRTLQGLEASGALKTDANGQSNAEIYLQRLILVNQQEGKNSPARKALNCLFNRDGTPKTNLSPEDIKTIQAGVEYSIQHTRTTRNGRGTITSNRGDYEAKTETREVSSDATRTLGQNGGKLPEGPTAPRSREGGRS